MGITKVTHIVLAAVFLVAISLPLYAQDDSTKEFIKSIQKGDTAAVKKLLINGAARIW